MLTPTQIVNCYNNIIVEIVSDYPDDLQYRDCAWKPLTELKPMTEFQWNNLVKVCSIIKANSERFYMEKWHDEKHSCGTTHCIAGWAASLLLGDTNLMDETTKLTKINSPDLLNFLDSQGYNIGSISTSTIGVFMLSDIVYPFFYLTRDSFGIDDEAYDIEDIIMREFIDVVLEAAKDSSQELTQEINQLIAQMKQPEVCFS